MYNTKFLFRSLIGFAALALGFTWLAGSATRAKSAHRPVPSRISFDEIDVFVKKQLERQNVPGAALVIVEGEKIVHFHGFGRARPGGEAPTPQTPFFIGSTTKSFTATAIMQLVEAGKVDLEASVQRYLPWFRVADHKASAQITVRQLLYQTSGIPLLPGWQQLSDLDNRPDATERQMRALSAIKLAHPVGTVFEYSNVNYNLLGLIIEAASGKSYAAYIQKHIFNPLEMTHSHTSKAAARKDGLAVGHLTWFGIPVAVPNLPVGSGSLPAGLLISSAEDMGHYLIAHLNEGRYGKEQVLSPEGIVELHNPAVDASSFGVEERYGMGWYTEQQGNTKIIWHSGLVPDFYAYMALLPEQKRGVVLLVNMDHFTMQPTMTEVGGQLATLVAGHPSAPNRFGFLSWATRILLLIPILQILGVISTLQNLNRWKKDPQSRPNAGYMWGWHILLPLIPNLLITSALIPMLGKLRGFLMFFMPDLSWLARICGGFAGIWTLLRTGLILRVLRKDS